MYDVITFDNDELDNFLCIYTRAENERNYVNLVHNRYSKSM